MEDLLRPVPEEPGDRRSGVESAVVPSHPHGSHEPPGTNGGHRDRIIDATLDCLVTHGVAGTSMRMVAEGAHVSLGSVTHHFVDKDALLSAAFQVFADRSAARFREYYEGVDSLESARRATVHMLTDSAASRRGTILGNELYTLSLRRPRHRMVLVQWTHRCRKVIREHFDAETTYLLDAFYEGVLLHRSMHLGEYPDESIALAVQRLTPPASYLGRG